MLLQTYKLTSGSSNLKLQQKFLCERDERKICYIYKRKKQISPKSLEGVEWSGEDDFSVENLTVFFQDT